MSQRARVNDLRHENEIGRCCRVAAVVARGRLVGSLDQVVTGAGPCSHVGAECQCSGVFILTAVRLTVLVTACEAPEAVGPRCPCATRGVLAASGGSTAGRSHHPSGCARATIRSSPRRACRSRCPRRRHPDVFTRASTHAIRWPWIGGHARASRAATTRDDSSWKTNASTTVSFGVGSGAGRYAWTSISATETALAPTIDSVTASSHRIQ